MRKLTRNAMAVSAAAAATVALAAVPASASGTWTVSPGGTVSGVNTSTLRALDLTHGTAVTCSSSSASGTVDATATDGVDIASLNSVTFSTPGNPGDPNNPSDANWCTGPVGIVVKVTAIGLPWKFQADSFNSGVTTGRLTGVKATIHGSDGCDATITGPDGEPGEIAGTHTNPAASGAPSILNVTGNSLKVNSADADCDPTLITEGDQIQLTGQYALIPGQTITFTP